MSVTLKILVATPLIATLAVSSPAQAQNIVVNPNYDTVVMGSRSLDTFVSNVNEDLNRTLNRSDPMTRAIQGTGIVQVLFECGPDGKPTNISYYRKDNDGDVNRLAVRAVSKIRTMHPLPQGLTNDQLYLANVIIAKDSRQFNELSEELNERETNRIAAAKGDRKIFAFTLSKTPST